MELFGGGSDCDNHRYCLVLKVAVMMDRTYLPVSLFADNKYRTVSCLASFGNEVQKAPQDHAFGGQVRVTSFCMADLLVSC